MQVLRILHQNQVNNYNINLNKILESLYTILNTIHNIILSMKGAMFVQQI
jgi:hypothetical protein